MQLSILSITEPFVGKQLQPYVRGMAARYGVPFRVYVHNIPHFPNNKQYGITPQLAKHWEKKNIKLILHVIEDDDTITEILVEKFREVLEPDQFINGRKRRLQLSKRELNVLRRILDDVVMP